MMCELVVHAIFLLLISFNNYDYDNHMNFIIFMHLSDTFYFEFQYYINKHVTNAKINYLF